MRRNILPALLIVALIGGAYVWYANAGMPCRTPLTYSIGTIDPRFNLSEEEVRAALADAEALWEDAAGEDLFVYDEKSSVTVNLTYDDRQQLTDQQQYLSATLEQRKELSEEVKQKYDELLAEYKTLKVTYEARVRAYESRLDVYERNVEKWNAQGGAPTDEYAALNAEKKSLAAEQKKLQQDGAKLNGLVSDLNALGEQGNGLVTTYNNIAQKYNDQFGSNGHDEQFTQGDYQKNVITIYEYRNAEELRLVLAHEFGHALGLDHVDDSTSIMYFLMNDQQLTKGISSSDMAELRAVCDASPTEHFLRAW
ncbi:matrixin family metalloprotease [Candidatus Parcubacteria bacterium]|uniref:Peptidase M10 metallopeptidase domain-containing protein n=1 Tax=Candidatus Kaiserbacteria bacterium CG10_big_fil_rev_8_21_14_0_10_47_16 TaxID=1974608 RepID=A0A2H0UEM4_9BACT|nr:matrixin family metalloprotease [Candidatus Parcubacteria bacterium]PIR84863.1 MAG: hypothetical protein COU16_00550 [Candidatus Kaiserbacteria bacterium CG10_big_fil_rev_8_21_14_0_10_47_16]